MNVYVLDTNITGFAMQQHPKILSHMRSLSDDDSVVTTIVTFGEDLSGWMPACRRAPNGVARAQAYAHLQRGLDYYRNTICLPFDNAATIIFDQLRAQKIRISTNDLAIAAITLSVSGILITRNAVDFQRVPGLVFEDWTR